MVSLKRWLDRRRNPWKSEFHDAFNAFRRDNAVARLHDYSDLPAGAVVFDFGGFRGDWTRTVLSRQPECTVHVFEPHPGYAAELRDSFAADPRVHVHECALGAADGTLALSDAGDASSAVAGHDRSFAAQVVSAKRFFEENHIPCVDLSGMNIEGGEYELLPALIDAGLIGRFRRLQVQFHLFDPGLAAARDAIRSDLERSHDCTLCYPFVWEEWRAR